MKEWNCFVCLNREPSRIRTATRSGPYPNGLHEFYYCDDAECEKKYTEMHDKYVRPANRK